MPYVVSYLTPILLTFNQPNALIWKDLKTPWDASRGISACSSEANFRTLLNFIEGAESGGLSDPFPPENMPLDYWTFAFPFEAKLMFQPLHEDWRVDCRTLLNPLSNQERLKTEPKGNIKAYLLSSHLSRGPYLYLVQSEMILSFLYLQFNIHEIYTTYICFPSSHLSHTIWDYSNGRFFFYYLSFHLSKWKQRNVSLWSELILSGKHWLGLAY